jgi:hypothetical protein
MLGGDLLGEAGVVRTSNTFSGACMSRVTRRRGASGCRTRGGMVLVKVESVLDLIHGRHFDI